MVFLLRCQRRQANQETMYTTKHPLASRTIWVQILTLFPAFLPMVQEWLASNPVAVTAVFTAINVLVRFVTRDRVKIFAMNGAKSGAVNLILLSGLAALALFCVGSLTSCAEYREIDGTVYYRDAETGAKGGLILQKGEKPKGWLRVPVETETGQGFVDLTSGK